MAPIDFLQLASENSDQFTAWRREFHRHPELAYQEQRSASIIKEKLESWGYKVESNIAETGILATLPGKQRSGGVLVRFDMDALPIQEMNDVDYASQNPGVMHACGHDGHMAIGLGVAQLVCEFSDRLDGGVYLIFQPAEEGQGGAQRMLDEGVLAGLEPELALGVHLWNEKPLGWFGISPGPIMAGAESFRMRVFGQGGHGGMPDLTRDPIVAACSLVTGVQSIVSRSIDPLDAAVLSVTHIEGGRNFNVIPDDVLLEGTIRTLAPDTRVHLIEQFEESSRSLAAAHNCSIDLHIEQVAPPVINDAECSDKMRATAERTFPDASIDTDYRVMVSEDMALFLDKIPGTFTFVGSANDERGLNSGHHTSTFDFDEQALTHAVALLGAAIWEKLGADV